MREQRKTIYLLDLDNYSPDLLALTRPRVEAWADKIRADIHVISSRRFPSWPRDYEKLQIRDLAREHAVDWAIYIDSDALIHPDTPDFTSLVGKRTVMHNGVDFAPIRWRYDEYMLRDGRHIGSCNWFAVASDWCLDLWQPLDITLEEAMSRITPINAEQRTGNCQAEHLISDFTLSRNIARYGLDVKTITELTPNAKWFWHAYNSPVAKKLAGMKRTLSRYSWGGDRLDREVDQEEAELAAKGLL